MLYFSVFVQRVQCIMPLLPFIVLIGLKWSQFIDKDTKFETTTCQTHVKCVIVQLPKPH